MKKLKPAVSADGYLKTMLKSDEGKYVTVAVHRVIASAFLGEKKKGYEVNHKNGIKTDNSPTNLEYCTRSENCKHSFDTGLQKPKRGESNGSAKLTDEAVRIIRSTPRTYGYKTRLAAIFGVSPSHIKDIVSGRRGAWKHIQ